jgi:hypothetical protein
MFRGVGHRSFIGTIKFDNYFMDAQLEFLKNNKSEAEKMPETKSQSSLIQRLKTQKSNVVNEEEKREFRIITGGEDG